MLDLSKRIRRTRSMMSKWTIQLQTWYINLNKILTSFPFFPTANKQYGRNSVASVMSWLVYSAPALWLMLHLTHWLFRRSLQRPHCKHKTTKQQNKLIIGNIILPHSQTQSLKFHNFETYDAPLRSPVKPWGNKLLAMRTICAFRYGEISNRNSILILIPTSISGMIEGTKHILIKYFNRLRSIQVYVSSLMTMKTKILIISQDNYLCMLYGIMNEEV